MNTIKLLYPLALSLIFMFGCSGTRNIAVPTIEDISLNLPAKSGDLTIDQLKTWAHADLATDTIPGISLGKAYAFLNGKENTPVIVAIADTGLDIEHEDLSPVLWTNKQEIADGKDNDGNGFVDDIHGWNFLGDTYDENLEMTRMVRNFQQEFGKKKKADIAPDRVADFELFKKLEKEVQSKFPGSGSYFNLKFNARKDQPDPYSYEVKVYGDAKVKNTVRTEAHASHVGGIVAAARGNGIGINGIADNVQLMPLRLVPRGDEYDKDVALGIRYAVDNGAKIINASFGKGYSPNKEWVYEAIKYAAAKDVLIVLAAGNNGQNIDLHSEFPNDTPDGENEIANNVLMVGATTYEYDESLPASFSNYGKRNVDIFAPGSRIYSTVPGNKYLSLIHI